MRGFEPPTSKKERISRESNRDFENQPRTVKIAPILPWHFPIIEHIHQNGKISAMEAEKLWKVTRRTATTRLKKMCQDGLLVELSTGSFDPYKTFILAEPGNQPRRT